MNKRLPETPRIKSDLMFEGVRWTSALADAMSFAAPNFYPYRFGPEERDQDLGGTGKSVMPYLLTLDDGTLIRLKGNPGSSWRIEGPDSGGAYSLWHDGDAAAGPVRTNVSFDPRPSWSDLETSDGTPMSQIGVDFHGEMLVVNLAPGCQYFTAKPESGKGSLKCTFCGYGRPDERMAKLGQTLDQVDLAPKAHDRLREALRVAKGDGRLRHVYLVGGSMTDWAEEGRRFLDLARVVREEVGDTAYIALGSGALPAEQLAQFHAEGLIDGACFNLEVWGHDLFKSVCPGKERFVGWERWLESLYAASALWGRANTFTAMVGGIELEPEHGGWSVEDAVANAMQGARTLLDNGVTPVWSLYWPPWGADHRARMAELRRYFDELNVAYATLRQETGVVVNPDFLSHKSAYMQLECDMDRALAAAGATT